MPPGWLAAAPVTRALLVVNVAIFAIEVLLARAPNALWHLPSPLQLAFGANYAVATINEHRLETLVTSCFLHGGIMHLALNMLVLWQAGPLMERSVGSARVAPLYLLSGVVSSVASATVAWRFDREVYGVGASGAIMGVLASALVLGWRVQGFKGPLTQAMLRSLVFILVLGIVIDLEGGNVDNWAHVGGAVAGALVATTWRRGVVYSPARTRAILVACAAILLACFGVVAARDITDPFATMLKDERLEVARAARIRGLCTEARRALGASVGAGC